MVFITYPTKFYKLTHFSSPFPILYSSSTTINPPPTYNPPPTVTNLQSHSLISDSPNSKEKTSTKMDDANTCDIDGPDESDIGGMIIRIRRKTDAHTLAKAQAEDQARAKARAQAEAEAIARASAKAYAEEHAHARALANAHIDAHIKAYYRALAQVRARERAQGQYQDAGQNQYPDQGQGQKGAGLPVMMERRGKRRGEHLESEPKRVYEW